MKFIKEMFCFTSILVTAALIAVGAGAQESAKLKSETKQPKDDFSNQTDAEFNPLKTADTSSPRDTLRSFLTDLKIAVNEWLQNGRISSQEAFRASERAISTLDFSTTPYSDARMVITRRILMLLEILGRIELPSYGEIPGDAEVARDDLRRWTIPGTSTSINRIEEGQRAGEFLFLAWSVQRIPRFYLQVKYLPYKPPFRRYIQESPGSALSRRFQPTIT